MGSVLHIDQENMDIALVNLEVGQFFHSLEARVLCKTLVFHQQVLFTEGQCFHLHGFTKHAIEVLKAGKVHFCYNGTARRGVDHAKSQALQRMRRIVKVCQAAARAEFPSFDVVASFKIFNLEAGPSESTDLLDVVSLSGGRKQVEASDSLERLAKVFQVACNQLVIEFELLRNIAEAHIKATGARNREAWQHAWRSYHSRSSRHKLLALDPAAWPGPFSL